MDNPNESISWWLWWATLPYGLMSRLRADFYRRGWLSSKRLPCRVVSIGNLTVGGTGKTPVVIYVAEWLLSQGKRVGVLSRGYRRRSRDAQLLVSDGKRLLVGPTEAGDEPYLIAKRCPRAVVAVGADRYKLGRWVLERFPIDCFLLDDGFQHLRLHRDVDLLLVDATDPVGLEGLFPAGRLREPLTAVRRASAVLVTRADVEANVRQIIGRLTQAYGQIHEPIRVLFKPDGLVSVLTGERQGLDWCAGKTAVLVSAIGNSSAFHRTAMSVGIQMVGEHTFRDHHVYTSKDVEAIRKESACQNAALILTTEKDAGKLAPLLGQDDEWWALSVRTECVQGEEMLRRLILHPLHRHGVGVCA